MITKKNMDFVLPLVLAMSTLVSLGCATTSKNSNDAAKPVAAAPTAEQNYETGRLAAAEVTNRFTPIASDEVTQYVNRVGQYVALHMDRTARVKCSDGQTKQMPLNGYRFGVVANERPMIFSTPGGFVFLTSGFVSQVKSEDQLAGVLAHEMMHVMCGDNNSSTPITGGNTEQIATFVDQLMTRPYTRAQLAYADRAAIIAMYRAGYYPAHYVRFVQESQSDGKGKHIAGIARSTAMKKDVAKLSNKIEKTVNARRARFETFRTGVLSASAPSSLPSIE